MSVDNLELAAPLLRKVTFSVLLAASISTIPSPTTATPPLTTPTM